MAHDIKAHDIAHWKRQVLYLKTDLAVLESGRGAHVDGVVPGKWINLTAEKIADLKKQIAELERHVKRLERRKA
jgi:hypothetical protein